MTAISTSSFTVNKRVYEPLTQPIVVICLDGSADEYLDAALCRDRMPNLKKISREGCRIKARGALPSFTNVNNSSIVTGVPPSMHGICGNFFYDPDERKEVMMNASTYLRAGTILSAAAKAGRKVAVVTAKEKLRDILSYELEGIAFSAEKADESTRATHGIDNAARVVGAPKPAIYSADASLFVLKAGTALIKKGIADFLYLSLTDYMQHTYAPEEKESLDFYAEIDAELGRMLDLGALIGATADHGMNAKQNEDGSPNVIYVETLLNQQFGEGFRVICPITDPYVKHHGALGSFVTVYLPEGLDHAKVAEWLLQREGIVEVHNKEQAVSLLELPGDRIGDLTVLSGRNVVLGRTAQHHDLSALDAGLRSHGGRYEEMVPFIISKPLNKAYQAKASCDPRNFDIFDYTINGSH